jgi:hypothetical protein
VAVALVLAMLARGGLRRAEGAALLGLYAVYAALAVAIGA